MITTPDDAMICAASADDARGEHMHGNNNIIYERRANTGNAVDLRISLTRPVTYVLSPSPLASYKCYSMLDPPSDARVIALSPVYVVL